MIKREKTEDALLKMGMPAGILGFTYIADAVEILERDFSVQITKGLYLEIAEKRNTTGSRVERAIRHALEVTREKGDIESVDRYIGFDNCSNANSLKS